MGISDDREREYRVRGWWPGERLEHRYHRIAVSADPDGPAVADSRGRALTHRMLWSRSGELAGALARRGVARGDVVMILSPNLVEWQVALLATLRVGAVPATVPMTTDVATLTALLDRVGGRTVVAGPPGSRVDTGELALGVAARSAGGVDALVADGDGGWRWAQGGGESVARPPHERLEHLFFTSSTTGTPKAVMHTVDTLAALNLGFTQRFGLGRDTPIFMGSPLGHSVGSMHGGRLALYLGAPLVLQERWDPEEALALVAEHRCAFTAAATPFLKDLVDAPYDGPGPKLASLRTFLCGGAPVPPGLMAQAEVEIPNTLFTVLWGMTEGGVTTCLPGDPASVRSATAGVPLPGLELQTVGPDGTVLAPGEEGELAMAGPGVFTGYLGQEDLYRSSVTEAGFFRTGDLARIDGDGYLHLTGRLKDLIIRGGVNISPLPIEDAIATHPGVRRVAVIGLPDERMGERICAVVVPAGAPPELGDVIAWAERQGLPRRLWPEVLRVVDEMPTTAAGKIRKNVLAERLRRDETSGSPA
jgi:acyl-CoA synthetase (AMP-forming)/AMP-acid ligase II